MIYYCVSKLLPYTQYRSANSNIIPNDKVLPCGVNAIFGMNGFIWLSPPEEEADDEGKMNDGEAETNPDARD